MADESESSGSDMPEVAPSLKLITPRIPALQGSPLSTKREKMIRTPQFRRDFAPKVAKTAPVIKSLYSCLTNQHPKIIERDGSTSELYSPMYKTGIEKTYFEQCFEVIATLGHGSFGMVYAVQSLEDLKKYAVKISIQKIKRLSSAKYREVENHMRLPRHPNLVQFVRAWEDRERIYIQQELCERSLQAICFEERSIPEEDIWNIFIDLLRAVHHLHSNDMVHDDIKPDNIFITAHKICKLGDFGLVINLKNKKDLENAEEGDSKYLAPEVLNGRPSKASDIFSLGVTVLEAATDLYVPSNGESWHLIRNGEIPERFFAAMSTELRHMVEWMIQKNPNQRPTTFELLASPSIKSRILKRKVYVKSVEVVNWFVDSGLWIASWFLLFFATFFHPIKDAIDSFRSKSSTIYDAKSKNQHTPVQTPEATRLFVHNNLPTPFDFSDEENSATRQSRRLFETGIPKFSLDDDDDEIPTSSSNSSAVELVPSSKSSESPKTSRVPPTWLLRGRTPNSARRILPQLQSSPHQGSGDYPEKKEEMSNADLRNQRYLRMMRTEAQMDADENSMHITMHNGSPRKMTIPSSCPAHIRNRRLESMRFKSPRAPRLDFTLLDGDNDGFTEVIKRPALRPSCRGRMFLKVSDQGSSADES